MVDQGLPMRWWRSGRVWAFIVLVAVACVAGGVVIAQLPQLAS